MELKTNKDGSLQSVLLYHIIKLSKHRSCGKVPFMKNQTRKNTFFKRFEKYGEELNTIFLDFYRDEDALERFHEMLLRSWTERSDRLKRLDASRLQDPDWYKKQDMLGMQMYVDAFAGNLNGVHSKLDYIQECGVNYLHLMPLLQSPKGRSDGGYAVADFRKIQPELGTMEDLAALTNDCHKHGISVCLDFVMNHTSEDHEWARRARAGEAEYQDRYFFYDDWTIPEEYEKKVPQVFPTTAPGNFSWCEEAGKVVMTTFYPYQWDLNYANPAVFIDMTENMLFLCNQGIDIIRLDAVPYIWKELGTNCRNLPQVHKLVRMMRIVCEIVCPGTLLLGEVVMEPSKVVPYFGTVEKPECHMLYNVTTMASTWHTVATKDTRLLRDQLNKVFALPKEYGFLNYLRCHDDIGWGLDYAFLKWLGVEETPHKKYLNDYLTGKWPGSPARGELYNDDPRLGDARLCGTTASLCGIETARHEKNEDKLKTALRLDIMLHAYMFTLSGIPILYSGDEIAQENDYSYHNDPDKAADSRYLHRGKMNWEAAEKRKESDTPEGKIFSALRILENIRSEHRCFDGKADTWTLNIWDQSLLGIGRYYDREKLIALYNFSDEEKRTTLWNEDGNLFDLFTGHAVNKREVEIPAKSFRWLLCDFDEPEKGRKTKLFCLNWDRFSALKKDEKLAYALREKWEKMRSAGDKTLIYSRHYLTADMIDEAFYADALVGASGAFISENGKVQLDYPLPERLINRVLTYIKGKTVKAEIESEDGTVKLAEEENRKGQKFYCLRIQNATERHLAELRKHMFANYAVTVLGQNQNGRYEAEVVNQSFNIQSGIRRVAEGLGIDENEIRDCQSELV